MSSNVSSFENSTLLEFQCLLEKIKYFFKFWNKVNSDCEVGDGGGRGGGERCSNINNSLGDGDSVIRRAKVRLRLEILCSCLMEVF